VNDENQIPLSDYEAHQLGEIVKWQKAEPGAVNKVMGFITKPLVWLTQKVVPNKVMEAALKGANTAGEYFADQSDIKRDAHVENISELKSKSLELSDQLSNGIHNWAIGLAGVEGGITGSIGLPGLAADIPAVVIFSIRTVHKIGYCYGFEAHTPSDNQFVMSILSAAGSNSMSEKITAIITLKQLEVILAKTTWKKMAERAAQIQLSKEGALLTIRALAKQLGINLTKRKAMQAIPIIGAGIGAAMNSDYLNDVSWAARRTFQEWWLVQNKKHTPL